jgi:PucR C-terminal helix-turn-helix domain
LRVRTVPSGHIPAGLASALRPVLATLSDELIGAIVLEVPAYARPLEGSFGRGVRRGVDEALARFLDLVAARGRGDHRAGGHSVTETPGREIYVALGRGEVRAGRTLDTLLGAYRVGARVAWRRLAVAATRHGDLGTDGLVTLAEMMFAYVDQISAASAEGYAQAQSSAAGERERLRERVAELLLDGGDPALIQEKARAASLRLPEMVVAVVAPAPAERALAARLPPDTPATVRDELAWAFAPYAADAGWRASLERALGGLDTVVGPGVPWDAAATSAARAAFGRGARAAGRLTAGGGPLFTDDHALALVLARDPDLVAGLAARRLAPLAGLAAATRARLAETLLHWLALRGQRAKVAEVLRVHPQTVRYRVDQLRALFGADLEDPDARFELELVLRAGHRHPGAGLPATGTTPGSEGAAGRRATRPG